MSKSEITLKRYDYDKKENLEIGKVSVYDLVRSIDTDQLAYFLSEFLNVGFKDQRVGMAVGNLFHSEHRTIQASLYRFVLGILIGLSKQEYFDARNETAILNAQKIAQMIQDGDIEMGCMI